MTQLERYDSNTVELFVNTDTGESFASIRGYARMSGKDVSTISRRFEGVAQNHKKTAEIQTEGGLQGVALISEKLISIWIVKDNPELAAEMLQAGVRVFLHTKAGYKVESTATKRATDDLEFTPQPGVEYVNTPDYLFARIVNPRKRKGTGFDDIFDQLIDGFVDKDK